MDSTDAVVIGAGVVGLAIARQLAQSGLEVLVLEGENAIGTGTSSRNSEVIHAGIYYPAGSLKAELCVRGKHLLYQYCQERDIGCRRTGKLIVASDASQVDTLRGYIDKAAANGVDDLRWVDVDELAELEPEVVGFAAVMSPSTGIVDSHALMLALQGDLEHAGGQVVCRSPVRGIEASGKQMVLEVGGASPTTLGARLVVNAAGLEAVPVAQKIAGLDKNHVPDAWFARGHYYTLRGRSPFQHLVYPIAGSAGLGVHVTLDLGGQARFGPDVEWVEYPDYQFDDTRKEKFLDAIRLYYPSIDAEKLDPGYVGVRPKIVGPGEPAADFRLSGPADHGVDGLYNLFGIESPGLTASLAIAERVCEECNPLPAMKDAV